MFFFFFKQKTAYEIYQCDWSSDVCSSDLVAGVIAVADTLKEGSKEAVRALQQLGLEVLMITGDNTSTAEAIAREAGIDRALAEILPQEKAAQIKKLQAEGKRVAMVGDRSEEHTSELQSH